MAQDKNKATGYDQNAVGTVKIADDVVASIAAFAALEVEGVASLAGGADADAIGKGGMKKLGRALRVEVGKEGVKVDIALVLTYGCSIPQISSKVQDRIVTAIQNMTGLTVTAVNVRIAGMEMND